jgi:mRNA interferase MazF
MLFIVGIFSRVPEDLQDSWIRLDEGDPGFKQTGLRKASVIKTEKIAVVHQSLIQRTWPPFSGTHTKSKTNTPSNSWN